jgi:hypothetical protein
MNSPGLMKHEKIFRGRGQGSQVAQIEALDARVLFLRIPGIFLRVIAERD